MCIQDEKERLEAAVMKSGTVEKGIASIKKHGYVSCSISNAVGNWKGKVLTMEQQYQIALAFALLLLGLHFVM
jgi:hypothetical protein